MYCTECYLQDGKGTEDAQYVLNGKSLCNLHFWSEADILAARKPAKQKRGCRLPQGWYPTTEAINQIIEEFPGVTQEHLVREHRKFCDYWYGVTGQRGTKLDWEATWRNWMRKAAEQGSIGGGSRVLDQGTTGAATGFAAAQTLNTRPSTVDRGVDEALSRGLRLAALAREAQEEEDDAQRAQLGEDRDS